MAKGCFYSPFFVADIRSRTRKNQKTKPPTSCPKNRRFWGQTPSGESELSEKQAVLGTNFKRRERVVRKTGGFGYKLQAARASCPKNRRFWVQASSGMNELYGKGTLAAALVIKLQDNPPTTQFFINIYHIFYILTDTDTL